MTVSVELDPGSVMCSVSEEICGVTCARKRMQSPGLRRVFFFFLKLTFLSFSLCSPIPHLTATYTTLSSASSRIANMTLSQPVEPTLAITACDSYEGQRLALQLAEYLSKNHRRSNNGHAKDNVPSELVCLARDLDKCALLQQRDNVKVVKISYDDPTSLSLAIRGITTVILVPEMEPQRLDWVNAMVDTFKQEQVIRCVVISCIGTDASEKSELDAFRRMEETVASSIQRWTVLRYVWFLSDSLLFLVAQSS